MYIRSGSEIVAVDLLTHDTTVVAHNHYDSGGLAVDIKEKKLYFGDGNKSISTANLDGSGREVILKNANVHKMAIDWRGKRIFWTKTPQVKHIFVVNMDGKNKRTFVNTRRVTSGVALDPLAG
jgi:Tol biopolymer transport system component